MFAWRKQERIIKLYKQKKSIGLETVEFYWQCWEAAKNRGPALKKDWLDYQVCDRFIILLVIYIKAILWSKNEAVPARWHKCKTPASGAGGMGFKSPADQISTLCQRFASVVPLKCGPWCKPQKWAPLTRDTRKGIKRV